MSTLRFCYCFESLGIFVNASALDSKFFFGVTPESNSHYGIALTPPKRDKNAKNILNCCHAAGQFEDNFPLTKKYAARKREPRRREEIPDCVSAGVFRWSTFGSDSISAV